MTVTPIRDRARPRAVAASPGRHVDWQRLFDLAALTVFALEGATIAARAGVGALGILFAAFATGLVGGILRDLVLGETPPATLRTVAYPLTALVAGGVVCLIPGLLHTLPAQLVNVLDAAALGLFCVAGALKALDRRVNVVTAIVLGGISALGGGILRDVVLGHTPAALRGDMCAVAALAGAAIGIACVKLGRRRSQAMAIGVAACFVFRLVAAWEHWNLLIPHVPPLG